MRSRRLRVAGALAGALALAGCNIAQPAPDPSASGTATPPRPFTVMSTDPIRVTDPAGISDTGSAVLSTNVFQRLMTAPPAGTRLKPDAARDCLVTSEITYTCTLNRDLTFHNGHALTSSDVKFSIQRAARLAVPGSSASLLSSLRRIETPDDITIRFVLSRPDTQFGWALASPAASIVDEEVYNADELSPPEGPIVGSGPYTVAGFGGNQLELQSFEKYRGHDPTRTGHVRYAWAPDSATLEEAMRTGTVEVVWRGLDAAAITRLTGQAAQDPEQHTEDGFVITRYSGLRIRQLVWAPGAARRNDARVRQAINTALQGDRTSDSVVPGGVPGHISAFDVGGRAEPKVTWKNRIPLTLGYDPTAPDARDVATQIRTRLEDTGGLSVRLRPDPAAGDLLLIDRKAWTATALAWLQPYIDAPLPKSQDHIDALVTRFRATGIDEAEQADDLLAKLQRQAASDATVLPLSQSDEYMFTSPEVDVEVRTFGPGWQLGVYGIGNG